MFELVNNSDAESLSDLYKCVYQTICNFYKWCKTDPIPAQEKTTKIGQAQVLTSDEYIFKKNLDWTTKEEGQRVNKKEEC